MRAPSRRSTARATHGDQHQQRTTYKHGQARTYRGGWRPDNEILLQQVVGNRRLDFDSDKQRVQRCRHHFAGAKRGRADEHDFAGQRAWSDSPVKDIRRRQVRKRPLRATVAKQQIALPVERHHTPVEGQ
jgi:hypothetical protein